MIIIIYKEFLNIIFKAHQCCSVVRYIASVTIQSVTMMKINHTNIRGR